MNQFNYEILTDEELKKRMGGLASEYEKLRREALELNQKLIPLIAKCQIGLTYLEPLIFDNPKVVERMELAKAKKIKLYQPDKEALIQLELGQDLERLKAVEIELKTNDAAYDKYSRLLSYSQSEMKLR